MRHLAAPVMGTERVEGWPAETKQVADCARCGGRIIRGRRAWRHARSTAQRVLIALAIGTACVGVGVLVGVLLSDATRDRVMMALILALGCVMAVVVAGPRVAEE